MDDVFDFMMKYMIMPMIFVLITGCFLALFVFLPYHFYDQWKNPPQKFSLVIDEWKCTGGHEETYTTHILVGKVMVPNTSTSFVCDRWDRK